jgi:acylphosphatase
VTEVEEVQRGYRIHGRVQGVFYRAWTQETAGELGLTGTVRNRTDGSVEAHARGPAGAMRAFEERLWHGPVGASVETVKRMESDASLPEGAFQVLPTA